MAQGRRIKGQVVSTGLTVGRVHVVRAARDTVPTWSVPEVDLDKEVARLHEAVEQASEELQQRKEIVAAEAGAKDAEIFAVHRMVLQEHDALQKLEQRIREERINAEAALQAFIEALERTLAERLTGGIARSYVHDLTDPWRGVLDCLVRDEQQDLISSGEQIILAAAELTPQVVTLIGRKHLLGVICTTGARFSHGAVLARALGVPCVVGLPNLLSRLEQGMLVLVDGTRGEVQLRPDKEDLLRYEEAVRLSESRNKVLEAQAEKPAQTKDGHRLGLMVNVESLRDLDMFKAESTDGIGLLRTEFLYMERPQFPSEEEQFRLYRRAVEHMGDRPVVLRTLDIGADKELPYFKTPEEPNPALGWRGLRLLLDWPDLFRVQLRAMMRAGFGRDLRILFPMVTCREEIVRLHEMFNSVRDGLIDQGYEINEDIKVGIMIEVPSLLFALEDVVPMVDFVSVGTNDLVQYLLAVDRDNPRVAGYYQPEHPSVWRALQKIALAAREAQRPCSVCGDLAHDPALALLFLGLGYDSVSVAPHFVPEIKFAIRSVELEQAQLWGQEVLASASIENVRGILARVREHLG